MSKKTQLQIFAFQGHQLTSITDEHDEPWFIAKEIAEILDYTDAEAMTRKLDEDEVQNLQIVGFGNRGVNVINESGLWSSVLRSTKPEAKAVKKWLTSEVLPAIRKTGSYSTTQQPVITSELLGLLQDMANNQKQTLDLINNLTSKRRGSNSRPPLAADIAVILKLKSEDIHQAQIARELGLSTAAVSLILSNQYRVNPDGSVNVGAIFNHESN